MQLSKDAIEELGWRDVGEIQQISPEQRIPKTMDDLSDAQKEFLKRFLDRLPSRNKSAIEKVKKYCEPKQQ